MKGKLERPHGATQKTSAVVHVFMPLLGSRVAYCPLCKVDTSQGVLGLGLLYCALCFEVYRAPDEVGLHREQ